MNDLFDSDLVAWVHLTSTWFMVGLVWFVQCVHYPILQDLPPESVPDYQRHHIRRTSPLIPVVMLAEAASGVFLYSEGALHLWLGNLLLLTGVWGLTFFVIVPLHQRLIDGFDARAFRGLLRWNALRSVVWTAHGVASIFLLKARGT